MIRLLLDHVATPIGRFSFVVDEAGALRSAGFSERHVRMERQLRLYAKGGYEVVEHPNPHGMTGALTRYFAGETSVLDALPVARSGTPFQDAVWCAG